MKPFQELTGRERSLREMAQTIHFWAQAQDAAAVGALHVTCSDESERECAEALHHGFIQYMLPPLKFARRSAFQISTLGGRYEWGGAPLAEDHFLSDASTGGTTLIVAKVNAHVAIEELEGGSSFRLGVWKRYGRDSTCCGALASLLEGKHLPFLDDLREAFGSEGKDRLAVLQDPRRVDPAHRALYAAVLSARLQARKIVLDVQDTHQPRPTCWIVLPCVTVNRHERDTEILCGTYVIDGREGGRNVVYSGLGDDAAAFAIDRAHGLFTISDDQVGRDRPGRDHRSMARKQLSLLGSSHTYTMADERLHRIRRDVAQNKHRHHLHAKELLRIALPILADVAPIPVALIAFAQGVAGIHHAYRIHKLADTMKGIPEARLILDDVHGKIDQLDPEHAEALIELLVSESAGRAS